MCSNFHLHYFCFQWGAPDQAAAPTIPTTVGEDWGSTNWATETTPAVSKDWGDISAAAEPAAKEWGAEPSGDWGTSITMQDANSGGADWA